MRFTVLIPTFDHGVLIRPAIESVLAQTVEDFELLVVADGSPPQTHAIVQEYARQDSRVRLLVHEKGARHGERYRHDAIVNATTDAVCYLSDDDFWFPDHLETMAPLLSEADFAHTRHVYILPSLLLTGHLRDLRDPEIRAAMLHTAFNYFGPTVAGHRLDAYRKLQEGWAPAPLNVWTDLHMWRKWISDDRMRLRSSSRITSLHLGRSFRRHSDPIFLEQEPRAWYEAFKDPSMRLAIQKVCPESEEHFLLASVFEEACRIRAQAAQSESLRARMLNERNEETAQALERARSEVLRVSAAQAQSLSEVRRLIDLVAERDQVIQSLRIEALGLKAANARSLREIERLEVSSRECQRSMEDLRREMLGMSTDHSTALAESYRTRDALGERIVELAGRTGDLSGAVADMSAEVRLRDQALQALAATSETGLREAELALASKQAEVAALRSSNSWKITEPIRRLVGWRRGR